MTCQEFLARYSDYLDERMDAIEAPRWRRHVEVCPACARYDRILRKGLPLMRSLPHIEPSHDFFPRLQHRLFHVDDDLKAGRRPSGAGVAASLAIAGALAMLAWGPLLGPEPDTDLAPVEARATEPEGTEPPPAKEPDPSFRNSALAGPSDPLRSISYEIWRCRASAGAGTMSCRGEIDRAFDDFAADSQTRSWPGARWTGRQWSVTAWSSPERSDPPWSVAAWSNSEWSDPAWPGAEWSDPVWPGAERSDPVWPILPMPSFDPVFMPMRGSLLGDSHQYSPLMVVPPVSERVQAGTPSSWSSTVSANR